MVVYVLYDKYVTDSNYWQYETPDRHISYTALHAWLDKDYRSPGMVLCEGH